MASNPKVRLGAVAGGVGVDPKATLLDRLREASMPRCATCRNEKAAGLLREFLTEGAKHPKDYQQYGIADIQRIMEKEAGWKASKRALEFHLHDHVGALYEAFKNARPSAT